MSDELADAIPTCPRCGHRYEIAGDVEQVAPGVWIDETLYGLCPCGATPLAGPKAW